MHVGREGRHRLGCFTARQEPSAIQRVSHYFEDVDAGFTMTRCFAIARSRDAIERSRSASVAPRLPRAAQALPRAYRQRLASRCDGPVGGCLGKTVAGWCITPVMVDSS